MLLHGGKEIQYDPRTATRHRRTLRHRLPAPPLRRLGATMTFLGNYSTHLAEYVLAVTYLILFVGFWKFTMGSKLY